MQVRMACLIILTKIHSGVIQAKEETTQKEHAYLNITQKVSFEILGEKFGISNSEYDRYLF